MKTIYSILTIILHFLIIIDLKILDNLNLIIIILVLSTITGFTIKFLYKNKNKHLLNLGSGIFYGSLTSLISTTLFIIWLNYNFPK
jgi:hypothetical protein